MPLTLQGFMPWNFNLCMGFYLLAHLLIIFTGYILRARPHNVARPLYFMCTFPNTNFMISYFYNKSTRHFALELFLHVFALLTTIQLYGPTKYFLKFSSGTPSPKARQMHLCILWRQIKDIIILLQSYPIHERRAFTLRHVIHFLVLFSDNKPLFDNFQLYKAYYFGTIHMHDIYVFNNVYAQGAPSLYGAFFISLKVFCLSIMLYLFLGRVMT